ENNYKNAIAAGLPVGIYFYLLATTAAAAKQEANFVLEKLKGKTISYPVYIDMEDNTYQAKCSKATLASVCNIFCNTIKNAGYIPGVYASLSWFNSKIGTITAEHTKWVAQYYKECQYKGAYDMWQYTSSENVPGIAKNTDVSWCYKDFAKAVESTPETPQSQSDVAKKILDACKVQAEWMKNYTYKWESNPTIEKSKTKGTCVTYVACVLQRIGYLAPGECIWHTSDGKVYGTTDKMTVTYTTKTLKAYKDNLKAGDIVIVGKPSVVSAGDSGSHIFIFAGKWDSKGNPYIWDNHSATNIKKGKNGMHTYSGSTNIIAKISLKNIDVTKKKYSGTLPSLTLKKTNAQVINDAVLWAIWIAGDNTFHYGYTNKSKTINAHHNGCYFCGTNTDKGGRSKKGVVDYQHTYCCNPFVHAAWAHGGCVPKAMEICAKGSSWAFGNGVGYDASSLFTKLGHPAKSKLKAGDVLCRDTHVALYIGNGKIAEAGSGDDNKKGSVKWNNSIHIITLSDSNYAKFPRVYRFNSSVNTTAIIKHGEVSERVRQWQMFLNWYFDGKVGTPDGYYGDNTLKWTKQFQEEAIGKGQGDGLIGKKTLAVAKSIEK
ncbi:MAG: hypothetical protein IIT65_09870, partial [Lachnospiraceae bacterium]|nr:hypothetical protein [Lachnospiraceae bacterium]